MRISLIRIALVAGLAGAAAFIVGYATTITDVVDLKLVSVEAFRADEVAQLEGQAAPETPVFQVRFSTATDFTALANQLDAFRFTGRVLVGNGGCNPDLDTFTYTAVAEMLVDFDRLYDEAGDIHGRSLWSSSARDGPKTYHFYFGVLPDRLREFVSAGLMEAPLCFEITGASRIGRPLYSNIVMLPPDMLGTAAFRMRGS
jgi:hypothetical protein